MLLKINIFLRDRSCILNKAGKEEGTWEPSAQILCSNKDIFVPYFLLLDVLRGAEA